MYNKSKTSYAKHPVTTKLTVELSCEMRCPNPHPTIEHNKGLANTSYQESILFSKIYLLVTFHISLHPQGSREWLQHVQPPHDTPIHTKTLHLTVRVTAAQGW